MPRRLPAVVSSVAPPSADSLIAVKVGCIIRVMFHAWAREVRTDLSPRVRTPGRFPKRASNPSPLCPLRHCRRRRPVPPSPMDGAMWGSMMGRSFRVVTGS